MILILKKILFVLMLLAFIPVVQAEDLNNLVGIPSNYDSATIESCFSPGDGQWGFKHPYFGCFWGYTADIDLQPGFARNTSIFGSYYGYPTTFSSNRGNLVIDNSIGKYKLGSEEIYLCEYSDGGTGGNNRWFFEVEKMYHCPDTFSPGVYGEPFILKNWGALDGGGQPPDTPPTPPQGEFVIDGLQCSTYNIPTSSGAIWNNDFLNQGTTATSTSSGITGFVSWSGASAAEADYLNVVYLNNRSVSTGSVFHFESFNWPGTNKSYLRGGESEFNIGFSDSEVKPNLIQLSGISTVINGTAGIVSILDTDNVDWGEIPVSESGGIATVALAGGSKIDFASFTYFSGVNGMRYSDAPTVSKTACSINFNRCEWSYEGADLTCIASQTAYGTPAGECVLAASGSVYGSGSCIPATNASGAIIPVPTSIGGFAMYDSNGEIVGSVNPPNIRQTSKSDFSCDIDPDLSWYNTIGEYFLCPIHIGEKLIDKMQGEGDKVLGSLDTLGQSTQIDLEAYTGSSNTSTGILAVLGTKIDDSGDNRLVKISWGLFIFAVLSVMIAILIGIRNSNKPS